MTDDPVKKLMEESESFSDFLPQGCLLCQKGGKMVLFVTGLCGRDCFYCPLSDDRKERDVSFVNERQILSDDDVIEEALEMDALGTGITGGEPLLRLDDVLHYMTLLKTVFGQAHHIHLYTSLAADDETLEKLASAGLDEIRFHPPADLWPSLEGSDYERAIRKAQDCGICAGIEIPSIEGAADVAAFSSSIGCFLNLNELEFSDNNAEQLRGRGYVLATDENNSVKGSRRIAEEIFSVYAPCAGCMKSEGRSGMNFCTSRYKDRVQLRLRLLRIASKASRPFDSITEDGTLSFGKIVCDLSVFSDMKEILEEELPDEAYEIIDDGVSDSVIIETAPEIAEELAAMFSEAGGNDDGADGFLRDIREKIRIVLVEKYPFRKGFVAESEQLLRICRKKTSRKQERS